VEICCDEIKNLTREDGDPMVPSQAVVSCNLHLGREYVGRTVMARDDVRMTHKKGYSIEKMMYQ
jgi:hypothetical protein